MHIVRLTGFMVHTMLGALTLFIHLVLDLLLILYPLQVTCESYRILQISKHGKKLRVKRRYGLNICPSF